MNFIFTGVVKLVIKLEVSEVSIIEKNTIEELQGTWFSLLVEMVLAYTFKQDLCRKNNTIFINGKR